MPETKKSPGFGIWLSMADKQPGAGEQPLLLLRIDLVIDKDLAADLPGVEIHQAIAIPHTRRRHRRPPLLLK